MEHADRIRAVARAVASLVGTAPAHRYLEIVAVVLYADDAVTRIDDWDAITNPAFKLQVTEAVAELRELVAR